MSSLIGKRLQGGKYKLEAVLGRGGFGLTFRAHQNYLDQVVVIKTLNEAFWSAPNLEQLQKQFQDEARRLALCSHPNVVRVSDFFVEDRLPYMVMDYIPGRSLYDMVLPANASPQPLSESAAVGYIHQIGKALQAVHAKGLLHRDVKPQNIMIHELTGEAVLIDFGIARELTQNPSKTHTSIVSEGYAPIEQYLPKAQRSAATDIYGLAATLYTLLTGEIPVAAVLRDRNPIVPVQQLRPDVSGAVANAIAQGMQIELKDRPQSVNRWLSSLTTNRTRHPKETTPQRTEARPGPTPSQFPTKVVAPAYQQTPTATGGNATGGRTVAVPLPNEGRYGTVVAPANPSGVAGTGAEKKGCGCLSTLAMTTLLIAGIAAAGGYWVVQRLAGGTPSLDLPGVELPGDDVAVEDPTDVTIEDSEDDETTAEEDADEADEENSDEAEEPTEEDVAADELSDSPVAVNPPAASGSPPLLLSNSGANPQPGSSGNMVAVPGIAPGDSANKVRNRLGAPSQSSTVNGYATDVYSVVPNRVQLGYVYDESNAVVQSEATFSANVDRLVMRTTLLGMLDGRSTRDIEQGLEAVRSGEQNRYDFSSRGFSGAIEKNAYGHIHIYVQE